MGYNLRPSETMWNPRIFCSFWNSLGRCARWKSFLEPGDFHHRSDGDQRRFPRSELFRNRKKNTETNEWLAGKSTMNESRYSHFPLNMGIVQCHVSFQGSILSFQICFSPLPCDTWSFVQICCQLPTHIHLPTSSGHRGQGPLVMVFSSLGRSF